MIAMKNICHISLLAAAGTLLSAALYCGLTVKRYCFLTDKQNAPMRLLFLSDLHGCRYGAGQRGLLEKIDAVGPDAVVMSGDMIDERMPVTGTAELLTALCAKYPCYYAAGNHEFKTGRIKKVKAWLHRRGVVVLDGKRVSFTARNGAQITLCGVDDPVIGKARFKRQLEAALKKSGEKRYTVLLSHRPELLGLYSEYGCDLVLSGHAHGGQWRLPGLVNGLIAPHQGLFPKYAGGVYTENGTNMVVSRGLARESTPLIPRVFNPPELVIIDLLPQSKAPLP